MWRVLGGLDDVGVSSATRTPHGKVREIHSRVLSAEKGAHPPNSRYVCRTRKWTYPLSPGMNANELIKVLSIGMGKGSYNLTIGTLSMQLIGS